jgi:hypothetical protein
MPSAFAVLRDACPCLYSERYDAEAVERAKGIDDLPY